MWLPLGLRGLPIFLSRLVHKCDIFFAISSSSARSLSVSSWMMDPKWSISRDTRLRDALCRMYLHFRSIVVFERYMWGSIQGVMFLGGWFLVDFVVEGLFLLLVLLAGFLGFSTFLWLLAFCLGC